MNKIQKIEVSKIKKSPYNVRTEKPVVGELMQNIKQNGLQQPISVRPSKKQGTYEVIAGNRRLHAFKTLKRKTIDAIVKPEMTDEQAMIHSFSENIMHENLTKDEQARAIAIMLGRTKLISNLSCEKLSKPLTEEELANKLGISRQAINKKLEPLRQSKKTRELVRNKAITEETAMAIRQFAKSKEEDEVKLAKSVANAGLNQTQALSKISKARKNKQSVDDLVETIKGKDKISSKALKDTKIEDAKKGKSSETETDSSNDSDSDTSNDLSMDNLNLGDLDSKTSDSDSELSVEIKGEKIIKSLKRYATDKKQSVEDAVTHAVKQMLIDNEYEVE